VTRRAVAIGLFLGQLIHASPVVAADAGYCEAYGRALAQILIPFVIRRAESTCGNAAEPGPLLPKNWTAALRLIDPNAPVSPEAQAIADAPLPGSVPATGKTVDAAPIPKMSMTIAPKPVVAPKKAASASPPPAEVCARAHRRIAWQGRSWRCVG
jgi:hypothetical protein